MTPTSPATHRPRVLIPVTISFSVRYLVRTGLLAQLQEACVPVIALSWEEPDLEAELRAAGAEVVHLPVHRVDQELRKTLRVLEAPFARRLATPSAAIDRRRRHGDEGAKVWLRNSVRRRRDQLRMARPGAEAATLAQVEVDLPRLTNVDEYEAFLRDGRIDAVFSLTPYVIQELVLLHAAQRLGLALITSILSFDNITTRPPLPVTFDRYLVWNRFNEDEILRAYPTVGAHQIAVVGPAQFDFYGDPALVEDRQVWCDGLDLPADAPTVLFGAGPPSITPHEPQYLDHILAAIDDGRLPADLRVVLRRHPVDRPERWSHVVDHPAVHFDDPWPKTEGLRLGQADMGAAQVVGLCSTLAHTDVHVNTSSTLTLDGAFYDKPQIGPAYDLEGGRRQRRRAIDLYRREHFVPIVASGGLELARSPEELVGQIASALRWPERLAPQRQTMLDEMCAATDFHATDRVAAEVRAFLATAEPEAHPA